MKFQVFSLDVPTSWIASYSLATFYVLIVYASSTFVRTMLFNYLFEAAQYEATETQSLIYLLEGVILKRHEGDLVAEEETYRMVVEIVRSPELMKALCGSSLRGLADAQLDELSPEKVQKIEHLDKLERKGFDVKEIREQIISKHKADRIAANAEKKKK